MAGEKGVKLDPEIWLPLLTEYRLTSLPNDTVLLGTLREGLGATSSEVRAALEAWPAQAHLLAGPERTEVVLVYQIKNEPSRLPFTHVFLLLATLLTTLGSGALMMGVDPFRTRMVELGTVVVPYPSGLDPGRLWLGASFALPFLGVLLTHEMGHYWAARAHRVRVSLPYFIPFPPYYSVIGSLGAFIRLKGPTVSRSVLFDIGAAGPLASLAVSLPMFVIGLRLSDVSTGPVSLWTPFLIRFTDQPVWLGNGALTHVLAYLFGPGPVGEVLIVLHPLALAGWLGLFVTALNLLPLGQLDGGHVLYALSPDRHAWIARAFLLTLIPLGLLWWGWWGWGVLVLVLHRGRVAHPRVLHPELDITRARLGWGWFLIVTFLLTLTPVPIRL
jgi:Zn-dependent protease